MSKATPAPSSETAAPEPVWRAVTAEEREMQAEILALKKERKALILAHNYQIPAVQDVADHVADSLGLARLAQESTADRIIFCGVWFMAETAKILNPERKVLIPDPNAGCSLVETITAEQLRAWKAEHPGAIAVGYVNTSAEVKAELDYCCTSSNAVAVVNAIPRDREVLFLPDMFLGAWVQRETGRDNMHIWQGECHVHAAIRPEHIDQATRANPGTDLLLHPECGCSTNCMYLKSTGQIEADVHMLSTSGMIRHAEERPDRKFLIATEVGILHQLETRAPGKEFVPVSEQAICEFMKMITTEKLLRSLREDVHEVDVAAGIRERAELAIQRMVAIG